MEKLYYSTTALQHYSTTVVSKNTLVIKLLNAEDRRSFDRTRTAK